MKTQKLGTLSQRKLHLAILGATGVLAASTGAHAVEPFECTGDAYSVRGNPVQAQLFVIDESVKPFVFTAVGPGATGPFGAGGAEIPIQLNNLGYRVTDNLLYAVAMPLSGNFNYGIVTIDSTGAVTPFMPASTPNWPAGVRLLAGDVSVDGSTMYVNTDPSSNMYIVDLENKQVTVQGLTGDPLFVADWAVSPEDHNLYGGDASGSGLANIYRLTPNGIVTDLGQVEGLFRGTGNAQYFGASWFEPDGTFVLYRNSDFIYEIDLSTSPPTLLNEFAGGGVDSVLNDGAACAATEIVKEQTEGPGSIGIYGSDATEITFEITYNGPATFIVDSVPAEFEVTACTPESYCNFFLNGNPKGAKAKATSATTIEWTIPEAGTYTLEVEIATRLSNGNKRTTVYKPTSCGILPINEGATAYEVDEFGIPVLDDNLDMIPLATSNVLLAQAVAGTKPCAPQGVTVTLDWPDTLVLDWADNAETVDHYNIYRGPSEDGPFSVIAETFDSEFTDDGLAPGYYCYQVKAAFGPGDDAEGNESGTVCETVP